MKESVRKRWLALDNAGQINTKLWKATGLPFEAFLRLGRLSRSEADANLRKLQQKMRERTNG